MAKVYVVGLDGSDIGYQALRLAAMVMNPQDDKIEVLHICLPTDDGEVATRLARNAEIELRKAQVNPLRFKICTETLRKPHSCQPSDRRTCTPTRACGKCTAAAADHRCCHRRCQNRRNCHHSCRRHAAMPPQPIVPVGHHSPARLAVRPAQAQDGLLPAS